ncbi:hypothetical protein NQZ68_013415, partial [Dissostichus eleginoides]
MEKVYDFLKELYTIPSGSISAGTSPTMQRENDHGCVAMGKGFGHSDNKDSWETDFCQDATKELLFPA